jgi:hypothetical protein
VIAVPVTAWRPEVNTEERVVEELEVTVKEESLFPEAAEVPTIPETVTVPAPAVRFRVCAPLTVEPSWIGPPAVVRLTGPVRVTPPSNWIVPAPVAVMFEPSDEVESTWRVPPEMENPAVPLVPVVSVPFTCSVWLAIVTVAPAPTLTKPGTVGVPAVKVGYGVAPKGMLALSFVPGVVPGTPALQFPAVFQFVVPPPFHCVV